MLARLGGFLYVAFCLSAFVGVMWVFGSYVAAPFGRWYAETTGLFGFIGLIVFLLWFWWWTDRREKRLIAEGKIERPRAAARD